MYKIPACFTQETLFLNNFPYVYLSACVYVCVCVCVCVRMCVSVCVCTYVYAFIFLEIYNSRT